MFRKIQEGLIINDIWSVSFENLKLNKNTKSKCENCFGDDIDDETIIIYSSSDDGIIVLGYYVLDDMNIAQSSMYKQLKTNTRIFGGTDKTEDLEQKKCKHICSWVFDESLRNKDYLTHIFEVMTFDNNNCLLWCEGHNEIIFYPLSERYAAIDYFSNAFLKE